MADRSTGTRRSVRFSGGKFRPLPLAAALTCAALTYAPVLATPVWATPQRQVSVQALAKRLAQWVADPDASAHQRAVHRVAQGVPPAALAGFLSAARAHPDGLYVPVIAEAVHYRNVEVRGHALAALAAVGPIEAERAIAMAADDHDATIRRLAWALSRLHPSPASHEIVARMLARDPELAEEILAAAAPDDDDLEIVFDTDDGDEAGPG